MLLRTVTHYLAAAIVVALAAAPSAWAGGEDTNTQLEEALHAYYYGDRGKAFRLLHPLAEAGCAKAQTKLSGIYALRAENSENPMPLWDQSTKWLRRAAENSYADAQFLLGFTYDYGEYGPERDYDKAVKWYRRAAEQGHPLAMDELGMMYVEGRGVERDLVEAYKWYTLSIPRLPPPTGEPAHGVGFNHKRREEYIAFRERLAQSMSRLALTLAKKKAQAWEEEHEYIRHMPETSDEPTPLWFNRIEGGCDD